MDKKMIETAKKYGTDSFEYFKAGCDIFNREELLERLFETTKEVIELQKRNEKAIDHIKGNICYDEVVCSVCNILLNILQGSDKE